MLRGQVLEIVGELAYSAHSSLDGCHKRDFEPCVGCIAYLVTNTQIIRSIPN